MEKPKNLYARPMDMNLRRRGIGGRKAESVGGGQRGKKWDNCNSITNRIYLKKEFLPSGLILRGKLD